MRRMAIAFKALTELGPRRLGLYAQYRLGLQAGYFRWMTRDDQRSAQMASSSFTFSPLLKLPERDELANLLGERGQARLLEEAEEIVAGRAPLFGSQPVPLQFNSAEPLRHWTAYELGQGVQTQDVKFTWEPARFGWAFTLGRAYRLSGEERYPAAFWKQAEAFLDANPPYLGLQWVSAQEMALRLIAFAFALQVFSESIHTSPERALRLARAIATHAGRIPPTLIYARAQNNNHLLTEAAGLYTAGLALPRHPSAPHWRLLGWRWFHYGLKTQIAEDGTYMQHSANYHRLMLQAALWMHCLARGQANETFPEISLERLASATKWLLALLDPTSGRLPNLGPNDGAYILPLTACEFEDYRPVLQAASGIFLGERPFAAGPWDEMDLWLGRTQARASHGEDGEPGLGQRTPPLRAAPRKAANGSPHVLRHPRQDSWAYLRVAHFTDRPGHADQLHLDLWWRGLNLAQDAGTYLYNAALPWDNALAGTAVHNTMTVNGQDQMRRAGRFLYLDWAQAQVIAHEQAGDGTWERLVATHDGYRRLGICHQRTVTASDEGRWVIEDDLLPYGPRLANREARFTVRLHWLAPDWPWEVEGQTIRLFSPHGWINLTLSVTQNEFSSSMHPQITIVRSGEVLYGPGTALAVEGWSSPRYGDKIPALAIRLNIETSLPVSLMSEWLLPEANGQA